MTEQTSAIDPRHAQRMDRMYRYTRHVYDATRKYYLFGRDRLLCAMSIKPRERVLEMGCGTARNLIKLHRLQPGAKLYGLDASQSMLVTAEQSLERHQCPAELRPCLAEELDHQRTFSLEEKFDVIFFSYSLSMMPTWPGALEAAFANLAGGGRIYIVDFWDQADLPGVFAAILKRWLALFHVHYRPELMEHLERLDRDGRCRLEVRSIGGRYAYMATLTGSSILPGIGIVPAHGS